jgi:hypothetical protein
MTPLLSVDMQQLRSALARREYLPLGGVAVSHMGDPLCWIGTSRGMWVDDAGSKLGQSPGCGAADGRYFGEMSNNLNRAIVTFNKHHSDLTHWDGPSAGTNYHQRDAAPTEPGLEQSPLLLVWWLTRKRGYSPQVLFRERASDAE